MYAYIFDEEQTFESVTSQTTEFIESFFSIELPNSYKKLMMMHNEGSLAYSTFSSRKLREDSIEIDVFLPLSIHEGVIESKQITTQLDIDERYIVFACSHHIFIAFDYTVHRKGNPPIVFIHRHTKEVIKVARHFRSFIKKLDTAYMEEINDFIYTSRQFERYVKKGKSITHIAACFEQFSYEANDFEWYSQLAIYTLKRKQDTQLAWYIGAGLLQQIKLHPHERWPLTSLQEAINLLQAFHDPYARKLGKQLQAKLMKPEMLVF